jgi:hypothetical protein
MERAGHQTMERSRSIGSFSPAGRSFWLKQVGFPLWESAMPSRHLHFQSQQGESGERTIIQSRCPFIRFSLLPYHKK